MAKKLKKVHADPESAIKRKECKILKESIKEVEKIKEEIPVPTPATVEDPMTPENKVVEVDKPETRADVDERSVIQRAYDRAEEKLTFKEW